MANSVWQATIQNAAGDIVPGAEITVIDEGTGLNAVIFSSKAGAALTNPFNANVGGFAQFYSGPGEYRITAFDIGTGLTQTFDNWRLGDAGARDVGTNTGELVTSEDLSMDNGEANFTSSTLSPSTYSGVVSDRIAVGHAVSSSIAFFYVSVPLPGIPSSITTIGTFNVVSPAGAVITGGTAITPTLASRTSSGLTVLQVSGLSGLTDGDPLNLDISSATAELTVNI